MNYEEIDTKALKLVEESGISYAEAVFRVADEVVKQPGKDSEIGVLNYEEIHKKALKLSEEKSISYNEAVFRVANDMSVPGIFQMKKDVKVEVNPGNWRMF